MSANTDYTLLNGFVYFKPLGEVGYKDLGNAPAFTVNLAPEVKTHTSSRTGLDDLEFVDKMPVGGSFTLDEPNADTLQMFVMSSAITSSTQSISANAARKNLTMPATNALGRMYELYSAAAGTASTPAAATAEPENTGTSTLAVTGTPTATVAHSVKVLVVTTGATGTIKVSVDGSDWSTGVSLVASAYTFSTAGDATEDILDGIVLTFTNAASSVVGDVFTFPIDYAATEPRIYNIGTTFTLKDVTDAITYVEGAEGVGNYTLNSEAGLIYINADQTSPANAIAVNDVLHVSCSLLAGTKQVNLAATATTVKGHVYFAGNPKKGRKLDVKGYVSITPSGDLSLIGTDWTQCQFTMKFLAETGVTGLYSVEDRGKVE